MMFLGARLRCIRLAEYMVDLAESLMHGAPIVGFLRQY